MYKVSVKQDQDAFKRRQHGGKIFTKKPVKIDDEDLTQAMKDDPWLTIQEDSKGSE